MSAALELPGPTPLLDENLVLRAGAGTGKTHALVTLALQLLAGLRRRGSVAPDKLWLVTFTDKAAAELRDRLRQRLRRLASRAAIPDEEADLAAAAKALGMVVPGPARWAALLDESAGCRITTLHGAGAALLRELPGGQGSFTLWNEAEASGALRNAARKVVLESDSAAIELLEDMRLVGGGPRDSGLVSSLVNLHQRLAEDGLGLAGLVQPDAPPDLDAAVRAWREDFEGLAASGRLPDVQPVRRALDALKPEVDEEGLCESWDLLAAARGCFQRRGEMEKAAAAAHETLWRALGEARASRRWENVRTLYERTAARYAAAKRAAFALDFADLCGEARNLLRDDLEARRHAKERVGALLLDETQDTNRVQLDLCLLLCEQRGREQSFAAGDPIHERVELEPGTLCAVGDRKQSIYEFRGADVAVFERLASRVLAGGGRELPLSSCRRSRAELVELFNGLFGRVMVNSREDFEIRFDDGDVLSAVRERAGLGLAELVTVFGENAAERRLREADALARRAVQLLQDPPAHLRTVPGGLRPGHVALLFRRLTYVELYREAFRERGLASAVAGGDGFYDTQEVRDVAALLAACVDPDDAVAVLALLRSPLCGVLDETVARLALASGGGGLSLRQATAVLRGLGEEGERQRVVRLVEALRPIGEAAEHLGPTGAFDAARAELSLRSAHRDAQAAANLDKLRGLLARWESEGLGLAGAADRLARFTRGQGEGSKEPQASGFDDGSLDAVRMLTIHQAKGLEFPVVMVPDCGRQERVDLPPIAFARDRGLAVKARGPDGKWVQPAGYVRVKEALEARARAESLRLLYVAATRARELLIFSGEIGDAGGRGSWRDILDAEPSLQRVEGEALPDRRWDLPAVLQAGSGRSALEATQAWPPAAPKRLSMAATSAADLLLCPRRFQLRQLWQVPERTGEPLPPDELPQEGEPRQLGSRAHELLEQVDLRLALEDPTAAVERAARELGPAVAGDDRQVRREVVSLLHSKLGRQICALPANRVWRERPFLLRAGRLVIRGSIDLLCVVDDRILVLDYKRGPPMLQASYRAQVEIYALAAARLLSGGLPIEGGLWYLGEAAEGPRRWPVPVARLEALSRDLAEGAERVALAPAALAPWQGLRVEACRAIDCAYLPRCHPGTPLVSERSAGRLR
ncbi:MAG TPA: UvrD-helicase domain-containing protein [Myxococcales bacterium]|nr:UvrD-helicase domain-containing protein [Myxococcales bacterium]